MAPRDPRVINKRYRGNDRIVTDDDFERAKAIQALGEANSGEAHERRLDLPLSTPAGKNIGLSVRIAQNRKERAINIAAPDEQASVMSLVLDAFGAQCFAYIQFGSGGVYSEADVDIARGCSLDLVMSSLTVDLINDTTVGGGSDAIVKAFAGLMPSGGHPSSRPTRTFARTVGYIQSGYQQPITAGSSLSAVAAAASRILVPPNFARDIKVVRTPVTEPFRVEFLDETGAVELYEEIVGAGAQMPPMEISNDCKLIRIVNTGAGATTYRAIFGLGL